MEKKESGNANLQRARATKNDEFYTQYSDIEAEMNAYIEYNPDVFRGKTILLPCDDPEWSNFTKYFAANFERFGLKKLISTSYAKGAANKQPTLFELDSPLYDAEKHDTHGKLFTLTHDTDGSGNVDTDDVEFSGYLEGDGDFRSSEVCKLRDEADIIITNPPFSLFREFLAWIMEGRKQFVIIGSKNAITYKEIFPLLKNNQIWLGPAFPGGNAYFRIAPEKKREFANGVFNEAEGLVKFRNVGWFTNIDHGLRHEPLLLDTMAHNLKYNKKLIKKFRDEYGKVEYPHYDNYDAIEVPFVEAIPSDYLPDGNQTDRAEQSRAERLHNGIMGVPITFLDRFCPEQFEIVGITDRQNTSGVRTRKYTETDSPKFNDLNARSTIRLDSGEIRQVYARILVRKRCNGIMGVPITFMDKYCPDQFEILGMCENMDLYGRKTKVYSSKECKDAYYAKFGKAGTYDLNASGVVLANGKYESVYQRILVRLKPDK